MIHLLFSIVYILLVMGALAFFVLYFLGIINTLRGNPPFVPVGDHALSEIDRLFAHHHPITAASVFIDPGCGNGKVLAYLAKKYPTAQFIGIELNLLPYLLARLATRNLSHVTIIRGDIFAYQYSQCTHVFTYLYKDLLDPLYQKIIQEAQKPVVFITCDFTPDGLSAIEHVTLSQTSSLTGTTRTLSVYRSHTNISK